MIADLHLDIAFNALSYGRGFEGDPAPGHLVSRRSLEAAGVTLVGATLFAAPAYDEDLARSGIAYRNAREARLEALSQLNYYRAVGLPIVLTAADLDAPGLKAVILMEGADPVETPAQVGDWWQRGVRIIGPAWGGTRYAGGTHSPGGLTPAGRRLLAAMAKAGMILDLSHLAQQAVEDALELWRGPVMASHSNARELVPGDRQVADATVAEVGRRGGVVGVSFYRGHLRRDRSRPSLEDVVRHLRHLARAAGGPEHVGLGTDCDGGFAADAAPFDDYRAIEGLRPLLRRHFSAEQVDGVMGGNWPAFLKRSLPTG